MKNKVKCLFFFGRINLELENSFVRFDKIDKSYDGEVLVVKNLNLNIQKGEFVTMLGPSGSGKTTTLMMLAGFETPTNGEIFLEGKPISKIPPYEREIGMVFQNYALFPHMTVQENLAFPLEVRKIPKSEIKDKVNKALDMVELGNFGTRFPAQLSGGQQQRVALARALVFEPRLVLMDEPLGALDKNLREQMQYEIKHIHERINITVVYVTHDQSEALTMSNRIAVFDDGVVQQLSTPDILYEKPENAFVAQFIGENNRFNGVINKIEGSICHVDLDNGEKLQAQKVNVENQGQKTQLSVRPERVVINAKDSTFQNNFKGQVRELIYLGDHIRVRLNVCGNEEFIVKVSNEGSVNFSKNDTINVSWLAEDIRALDFPK
ncbi:MAG: Spermidine/putrescine import ATP-binding protein PotA [Alphaproteobacteria bacterium MarineAlpha5_Bin11]|nr:MAG: Spermidine/putrescine import ATP-binding protein PotA [Alphaproteobacteria bacterium MarineAlpha5_Bin11]